MSQSVNVLCVNTDYITASQIALLTDSCNNVVEHIAVNGNTRKCGQALNIAEYTIPSAIHHMYNSSTTGIKIMPWIQNEKRTLNFGAVQK